ncbi:hydroxymethylcytosylglucuronate/cytosylglucuronate synthase [Streptomyces sp. URMC 126]|uniref:hydroxymethylcytosylglucuronate/cytosylglucurona te synthase n=1 Tax=Streptomyces sp. URMC 126 TaxID=3423401 RepID=UPI003F1AA353
MRPLRPPAPSPATVAVTGVEFGWGSAGKLSAVLGALRRPGDRAPLRFVGLGSALGRPLLAAHDVDAWYDLPAGDGLRPAVEELTRTHRPRAALVVLDGRVATALEAAGVPTVFVDSLPFLWTEGDRAGLPLDATAYCAQRCPELPPECGDVLASARSLRWVEAIVGAVPGARADRPGARPWRRALVSLGGLRAPGLADWTAYPRAVVPAALRALAAHGVREARLAGNLPAGLLARLTADVPPALRVTAGPLPHAAFLAELARCDVLVTSPGLTTLLEAGTLRVPAVCLPPQNVSQILNARFHTRAVGADVRAGWPADVLREDEALALRAKGEEHALELVYGAVAGAARSGGTVSGALEAALGAALRRAGGVTDWGALAAAVGTGGAAQVAGVVREIVRRGPRPCPPASASPGT